MAELERLVNPDGRLEIRVSEKLEAVLLNKISRKSEQIRTQVGHLRGATARFSEAFGKQQAANPAGAMAFAGAINALYMDLMQVLDIAETAGVDARLVKEARGRTNPVYRWGVPE